MAAPGLPALSPPLLVVGVDFGTSLTGCTQRASSASVFDDRTALSDAYATLSDAGPAGGGALAILCDAKWVHCPPGRLKTRTDVLLDMSSAERPLLAFGDHAQRMYRDVRHAIVQPLLALGTARSREACWASVQPHDVISCACICAARCACVHECARGAAAHVSQADEETAAKLALFERFKMTLYSDRQNLRARPTVTVRAPSPWVATRRAHVVVHRAGGPRAGCVASPHCGRRPGVHARPPIHRRPRAQDGGRLVRPSRARAGYMPRRDVLRGLCVVCTCASRVSLFGLAGHLLGAHGACDLV